MQIKFRNKDLERLETESNYTAGFSREIVKSFRKKMVILRQIEDERGLYAIKSLHFERLKGSRSHQHSIRLNIQWRLILEIKKTSPKNTLLLIKIEDYH